MPARSARSAAAAPWCAGCSGRCGRCRGRRRSGCPARSATSRRRWWPAPTRRPVCGANTRCCSAVGSRAYSGSTSVCGSDGAAQRLGGVADLALAGQEHQHVAGGSASSSRTASTIASVWSRISVRTISWSGSSGSSSLGAEHGDFQWPVTDLDRIGAPGHLDDRRARRSARRTARGSIVAEVTMTFRSGRRGSSSRR